MSTIPILQQARVTPAYTEGRAFIPQANIGPAIAPAQVALPVTNIDRRAPQARDHAAAQSRLTSQLMATDARQQSADAAAMERALIDQKLKEGQQAIQQGYYDGILEQQANTHTLNAEKAAHSQSAAKAKIENQSAAAVRLMEAHQALEAISDRAQLAAAGYLAQQVEASGESREEYLAKNPGAEKKALEFSMAQHTPQLKVVEAKIKSLQTIMGLGINVGDDAAFVPQPAPGGGPIDFGSLVDPEDVEPEDAEPTNTGSAALNELNSEINEKQEILEALLMEVGSKGAARQAEQEAERSPIQGFGRDIGNLITGPVFGASNKESRTLEEAGLSREDAMSALGIKGETGYLTRGFYGVADPAVGLFKSGVDTAQDELLDLDSRIKILQDALGRE